MQPGMPIQRGGEYLNFGPFLEVQDFEQVLTASQFDSAKHLLHSRGWGKGSISIQQTLNVIRVESLNTLNSLQNQRVMTCP